MITSDGYDLDGGIESAEIVGVGCHDSLSATPGTYHDVGIRDIGGATRCQQPADVDRIDPVQGYNLCSRIADKARQADLPLRTADGLR